MGWNVYGEVLLTADINGTPNKRVFQPVKFDKNVVLRACRTWLILFNDPAFTELTMQVYADDNGAPGLLLFESTNKWEKSDIITAPNTNAVKGVYFNFNDPSLRAGDTYHFIPKTTTYTGTDATHLSWRKGWPDPVYTKNVDSGFNKFGVAPYAISFIGADHD